MRIFRNRKPASAERELICQAMEQAGQIVPMLKELGDAVAEFSAAGQDSPLARASAQDAMDAVHGLVASGESLPDAVAAVVGVLDTAGQLDRIIPELRRTAENEGQPW